MYESVLFAVVGKLLLVINFVASSMPAVLQLE